MWSKIKNCMSAILLVAAFLGAAAGGHAYFAKQKDFNELVEAYKFDKTTERHNAIQERIWALEDMCRKTPDLCTQEVKEEIKHLKLELDELKRELSKKS